MMNILITIFFGMVFGLMLNKAGLTKYNKIVNVFRLTDLAVIKFMMTALVVAMAGLYTLKGLGLLTFPNVPATYILGNLVGGLVFGVGMAMAGYCPGTCVSGAGEGKLDYLIPGMLGFLTGAVVYGLTYESVFPKLSAVANLGNVVLPTLWNVNAFLFIVVFTLMALLLFYMIDRAGLIRKK